MRIGFVLVGIACIVASTASAQSNVEISRSVYVERTARTSAGESVRAIEPANTLRPGDRVILMVAWQGADPDRPLTVSSTVPRPLAFQRSSIDAAEVSVDGGRTWGRIGTLRIADQGGVRLAVPEDVTNLRWHISTSRAEARAGRLTYRAIVR